MTRRELLAALPAAALLKSARAAEVPYERIDTHNHIHRSAPNIVAAMEKTGWRGLSICDSRELDDQVSILPGMIPGTAAFHRESKGRWAWATTFDPRPFEQKDFAEKVIAGLRRDFDREAIAVKIWKNVGMAVRAKSGEYLVPDHPVFFPIYEAIQRAGKTLIFHLADPNASWDHITPDSPNSYAKSHPEWQMYGRPQAPAKEAILDSRDRVLVRYPKLRVICAHLGSNEENIDRLVKRFETIPTLMVDVASRVRNLMALGTEPARQFVTKYQDRLIYATDFTLGPTGDDVRPAQALQSTHEREWNFFATNEASGGRGGSQVQGMALPDAVLRKIFRENAVRMLPGIV
jgi:predicted TIM-barrel fold metal-dependent hydrolase